MRYYGNRSYYLRIARGLAMTAIDEARRSRIAASDRLRDYHERLARGYGRSAAHYAGVYLAWNDCPQRVDS